MQHEIVRHSPHEIHSLLTPSAQGQFRFNAVAEAFEALGCDVTDICIIVAQAAFNNLPPGTYMVDGELLKPLSDPVIGENLFRSGVFAAYYLSCYLNDRFDAECMPLAFEPVVEDEILPEASLSGIKGITRTPLYKALSQRSVVAVHAWRQFRKSANEIRAVAVHLGREISVGAFNMGRVIDNNCVQEGEGPFSPASSGSLPVDALLDLCYSGKYDLDEVIAVITQRGGLAAYLENPSVERVAEEYRAGRGKVRFLVEAMAAAVAREIGARAAALRGRVDVIVMAGPWVEFDEFVELIKQRVAWIAPITAYPYKGDLLTLALSAETAYRGGSRILLYGKDRMEYRRA